MPPRAAVPTGMATRPRSIWRARVARLSSRSSIVAPESSDLSIVSCSVS